ncbi:hypothetical protein D3C86_1893460 [compost metagenome]
MLPARKAFGRDLVVENRMVAARDAHERRGEQGLHTNLGPQLARGADEQVDATTAQRLFVHVVFLRRKAQHRPWHVPRHRIQKMAQMDTHKLIGGTHVETPIQRF